MYFKRKIEDIIVECEEIFDFYKEITCCFTGHRPQKLPWGFNEEDKRCKKIKKRTKEKIIQAIKDGYKNFISGMALGFDIFCAEIILELKEKYQDIKLVCAIPCKNQAYRWNSKLQERYKRILEKADIIRCVYDNYSVECMEERNQYMINVSSRCIALYNGMPGGTKKTLEYAQSKGVNVIIINPNE